LEENIRDGIAKLDPSKPGAGALKGLDVKSCAWGPDTGATPVRIPATLPREISTRAIGAAPDEDLVEAARWALLFDDPLFELRLVGQAPGPGVGGVVVGAALPAESAAAAVLALLQDPDPLIAPTGIPAAEFGVAVNEVAASRELAAAANAVGTAADSDFAEATARSIVATIIAEYRGTPPGLAPPVVESTTIRDEFVADVAVRLVPVPTRGAMQWFKDRIGEFLVRKGTAIAANHRLRGQEGSAGVVGDVTYYLRRGRAMADLVAKSLQGLSRPVVALGHSLGGIVLVDVLSRMDHPPVDLLVTVGSQSPILYAYDALERARARHDGEEPFSKQHPPFTPWLNIYNRNDFLSFVAADIFKSELDDETLDIVDRELHVREAFPAAHGAYWYDPLTFEFVAEAVARIPAVAQPHP
jgi:hypothetical protein